MDHSQSDAFTAKSTKDDIQNYQSSFISIGKAAQITGLHPNTLRRLCDQKEINAFKTKGGQRRFSSSSIQSYISKFHNSEENNSTKKQTICTHKIQTNFIYVRVSTRKQQDDLQRQIEVCRTILPKRGEDDSSHQNNFRVITDIASGSNFKRKGLHTILEACLQGNIGTVIIAHRDRLARIAYDLIEYIILKSGGKIEIVDDSEHSSSEQDLATDLLSIVHVFSCKQMGKRIHLHSRIIRDSKKSIESTTGGSNNKREEANIDPKSTDTNN